ncbi:hypothetical protein RUM43_011292 [Polyplax serrata]|uniref:Uncharacterized protein n=1 Tax=Polyplax serrata TaxID=468196 RepID=A0AAN8S3L7_POLSC
MSTNNFTSIGRNKGSFAGVQPIRNPPLRTAQFSLANFENDRGELCRAFRAFIPSPKAPPPSRRIFQLESISIGLTFRVGAREFELGQSFPFDPFFSSFVTFRDPSVRSGTFPGSEVELPLGKLEIFLQEGKLISSTLSRSHDECVHHS